MLLFVLCATTDSTMVILIYIISLNRMDGLLWCIVSDASTVLSAADLTRFLRPGVMWFHVM